MTSLFLRYSACLLAVFFSVSCQVFRGRSGSSRCRAALGGGGGRPGSCLAAAWRVWRGLRGRVSMVVGDSRHGILETHRKGVRF